MLQYVDVSAKFMIYSNEECNRCLDGGGTACQTRRNSSESMCCRESEYGASNCTSYPQEDNNNYFNFEFCSSEVFTHAILTEFACPFETTYCKMSPCLYNTTERLEQYTYTTQIIDNDCTYHNPVLLELCLGSCYDDECLKACFYGQNSILDEASETAALNPALAMCQN